MTAKHKSLAKQVIQAPFGNLYLYADDNYLSGITFREVDSLEAKADEKHPILQQAAQQLKEYFSGQRHTFDLPLRFSGTDFQQQVWQHLQTVPYGDTQSYQQVAGAIDNPKAVRAVGNANNKNPIVIVVPCHRVIGANGNMVGYGGGLPIKEWLLKHEQALS